MASFTRFIIQLPAKGMPKIPTASSAQISRNTKRIAPHKTSRYFSFFTFLNTSSIISPVPSNKIPIIRKSKSDQSTWSVNCIATKGMNNKNAMEKRMIPNLFFCVIITDVLKANYLRWPRTIRSLKLSINVNFRTPK